MNLYYRITFTRLVEDEVREHETVHIQQGTMDADHFYREYVNYYVAGIDPSLHDSITDELTTLYSLVDSDYNPPEEQMDVIFQAGNTTYKYLILPITQEQFLNSPSIVIPK